MIVRSLVETFIAWCGRHRAPATVRAYASRLKSFVERFGDREFGPETITPLEIDEWLHAAGEGKAADTQRLTIVAFERLQSWSVEQKLLAAPITPKLEKPSSRRRERIPEARETDQLLALADPDFRLIYRSLRQCGARPGELCRATIADYDRDVGVITLTEHKTARKTGRPRRIAVGEKFAKLLAIAIAAQPVEGEAITAERTEGPIFLRSNGKPWTTATLSAQYRRLRDKAGLPRDLVLYLARHEHGTIVCSAKGIQAAAEALGHANIQTTRRYLHPSQEELRSNQDVFDQGDQAEAA